MKRTVIGIVMALMLVPFLTLRDARGDYVDPLKKPEAALTVEFPDGTLCAAASSELVQDAVDFVTGDSCAIVMQ